VTLALFPIADFSDTLRDMVTGNVEASERSVKQWGLAGVWLVRRGFTVAAMAALSGCMFGDEQPAPAPPALGSWYDPNCVPAECMYQCCQGWNYDKKPNLRGGSVPGEVCNANLAKHPAYGDYVAYATQESNWCSEEYRDLESGYCFDIAPTDVIKELGADGKPVYLSSTFLVCPPRGQFMAYPIEDVEIIPKD
jgi:hypothetical protein